MLRTDRINRPPFINGPALEEFCALQSWQLDPQYSRSGPWARLWGNSCTGPAASREAMGEIWHSGAAARQPLLLEDIFNFKSADGKFQGCGFVSLKQVFLFVARSCDSLPKPPMNMVDNYCCLLLPASRLPLLELQQDFLWKGETPGGAWPLRAWSNLGLMTFHLRESNLRKPREMLFTITFQAGLEEPAIFAALGPEFQECSAHRQALLLQEHVGHEMAYASPKRI